MEPLIDVLARNAAAQTPEQREQMRRILSGEDQNDLIRRGDVYNLIREMRGNPVPSREFQKGISAVQIAVSKLEAK